MVEFVSLSQFFQPSSGTEVKAWEEPKGTVTYPGEGGVDWEAALIGRGASGCQEASSRDIHIPPASGWRKYGIEIFAERLPAQGRILFSRNI